MDQPITSMSGLFSFTQDSINKAANAASLASVNKTAVDNSAQIATATAGVLADATNEQLKLSQQSADISKEVYDQQLQMKTSLTSIFKEQQAKIDETLKLGQQAAIDAQDAKIEMLKVEAQDTGFNPIAWVAKQYHSSQLRDKAINKANEATARFETAATIESVTSNRMQQIATSFGVDKGLELQAKQQLNAEQAAQSRQQEQLLQNALVTSGQLANNVFAAKRQQFNDSMNVESWRQTRKLQDMQIAKFENDNLDENTLATTVRTILGMSDSVGDLAAARNIVKRMSPESVTIMARAGVAINGATSRQDVKSRLLAALTVPELHAVGAALQDSGYSNFGNMQVNTAIRKKVADLNLDSYRAAVQSGSHVGNQAMWEASAEGKAQVTRNNQQAQDLVIQEFSRGPASMLTSEIASQASFPKSFNVLAGLNDSNYETFLGGIKDTNKRKQVWESLKPGQPLNTQVSALANQYVGLGIDYTLANAMALSDVLESGAVGLKHGKSYEVAAGIIRSAAYSNIAASDQSAGVLIEAGHLPASAVKVPFEHNGLQFNLANPTDIENLAKREKYKLNNPGMSVSSLVAGPVASIIDYHVTGAKAIGGVLGYEGARKDGVVIPRLPKVNPPYKHTGSVDPLSPDFGKGLIKPAGQMPVDRSPPTIDIVDQKSKAKLFNK